VSPTESKNNLPLAKLLGLLPKLCWVTVAWFIDQRLLFEALFVAVSLHVLALPLLWVMGWVLPWPKSPTITTVIEYDLKNWPILDKPKKIFELRDPQHNQ